MNQDLEYWRGRVVEVMPELRIAEIELNGDGLINDVVIVNDELVFRFAKSELDAGAIEREARILDLIRSRVDLSVPAPVYVEHACMVYPFLPGRPLLRESILGLNGATQASIIDALGRFLYAMHTTPLSELGQAVASTAAPASLERILDIRSRVREKIYPMLLPHQEQWAEALYDGALADAHFFEYEPVLVHADLAPYHLLFDQRRRTLAAVLDFGTAGVGDAAQDFGTLISAYGEHIVAQMHGTYPGLDDLLPRARFRAQTIELQWVLAGLESGENFWFTAHLGGARDILG